MLRSSAITQGVQRAPNRAMLRAVGFSDGDFTKPIIGIANGYSTITPCNIGLNQLAQKAEVAIKKGGGKVGKTYTPDSRDPQLTIEFKGGNIDKIRKEVDKVGDGTEAVEEGYKSQKMQEWISANGDRRRVKEQDKRKYKVEDVVRDMWETASQEAKRNEAKPPVGKYQAPKLDESLNEGMKKSKMKIEPAILRDLKKLEKNEKGMNDKEVKMIHDFFKKGVEVVSDDGEPANISDKALKQFDKVWGKLDTFVRDEIYSIMKSHNDDQVAAVLGPYGA